MLKNETLLMGLNSKNVTRFHVAKPKPWPRPLCESRSRTMPRHCPERPRHTFTSPGVTNSTNSTVQSAQYLQLLALNGPQFDKRTWCSKLESERGFLGLLPIAGAYHHDCRNSEHEEGSARLTMSGLARSFPSPKRSQIRHGSCLKILREYDCL